MWKSVHAAHDSQKLTISTTSLLQHKSHAHVSGHVLGDKTWFASRPVSIQCIQRRLHRRGDAQAGATLLDAVRDALATAMTPLREHPVRVVAGTLGEQAQVLGAVTLVTQRMTLP